MVLLGLPSGVLLAVLFPSPGLGLGCGVGFACVMLVVRRVQLQSKCVCLKRYFGGVCIGLVIASLQFYAHGQTQVDQVSVTRVSGCVIGPVVTKNGSARFVFETGERSWLGRTVRYRITWYRPAKMIELGSCWRLSLRLKPLRGARNEAGFDYERWLFAQRLSGLASVRNSKPAIRLPWQGSGARYQQVRRAVYFQLQDLTSDFSSRGLIGALAVGMRDGLSDQDWDVLRRSGTAHLMAISGLHIGLAAFFGYSLGRYLPLGVGTTTNLHTRGAFVALLIAVLYAALAGFAVATVRALLMLVLFYIWRICARNVNVFTTLLLSMSLLLLASPWMIADTGFWLSVGAVAAIAVSVYGRPPATSFFEKALLAVRIQFGITMLMLPVSVLVAGGISWISIPVNLILIPLFSVLIVPLILILLFTLALVPMLSGAIAYVLGTLLDSVWWLVTWLADQPFSYSPLASISPWLTVPILLSGVALLLPRSFPSRWIGIGLVFPLFFTRAEQPEYGEFWLDVLDVGQALAIVIQTHSEVIVYDTGNAWPGGDSALNVLIPVLRRRQVERIHTLVVSHGDRDHAGGAVSLQKTFPIEHIQLGETVEGLRRAVPCLDGEGWEVDDVRFTFLHPRSPTAYQGNQQSCVLLIEARGGSALLTGDLGDALERRLIKRLDGRQPSVVVGAHHGSLSSSDALFINATQPEYIVFSNGYANQWGMPREEIVGRWQAVGTRVLTTAQSGQLMFKSDMKKGLTLELKMRDKGFGQWRWRQNRE